MGILYCVSTPIGNLADITIRALDILKTVNTILCEDTRTTKTLLKHYQINTPTESYHQNSTAQQAAQIITRLQSGENLALVSDAGTPGISDPGSLLIQQVLAAGITVTPIPGATALICALQAAGVDISSFVYLGFLPHKKGRQTLFNYIAQETRTVVFYESPHRILKTLTALKNCKRNIVLARELTKIHEEFIRGTAEQVYVELFKRPKILGEFVVIIHTSPLAPLLIGEGNDEIYLVPR
ncbi:MAG: 16S rRNA (cytidine(1402)-2'-O)-methyltransferase [Patescibacteria group bacterium]|jgi:16S rRNA (cytidine1402-2'-O)-methyltransferase